MGNTCSSSMKKTSQSTVKNSTTSSNSKKSKKKNSGSLQIQTEPITSFSTSPPKMISQQEPPKKLSMTPPPNLFLPATLSTTNREKFIKNEEEGVSIICSRLIDNEFNEFLLKEKNISKILRELYNMKNEKLASLNDELVSQFQKSYFSQLKAENDKIYQSLNKTFNFFSEAMNSKNFDSKLEEFHKSFACFMITLHHIFKNNTIFTNLHQSYYHKDCSRPVSNDRMFIEEKTFIYTKDLSQMPYIIGKGIVTSIVDNIIKECFYNQKIIHTIRDENFLDTWKNDHLKIFGKENDHIASLSQNYLLTPKGKFEN